MCYTRITHTCNGKAAIAYARGCGCGHNGHRQRNLLIGSVRMLPDEIESFETQMEQDWIKRASSKNKNQIRRIVASFSPQELDAQNEDCAFTALEIAQEFVKEAYPDRKACIFVQNDGVGEKLHLHILVSNVDSLEYKGCRPEQTRYDYVEQEFDRIAGRYIDLDFGQKNKEKLSQTERNMREENEEAVDNGEEPKNYIWKDDLRERIRIAMRMAKSEEDFLDELKNQGVEARYGKSKKNGEYLSYELVDVPESMDAGKKLKARSYSLGDDYGVDALRSILQEKTNHKPLDDLEQEKVLKMISVPERETPAIQPGRVTEERIKMSLNGMRVKGSAQAMKNLSENAVEAPAKYSVKEESVSVKSDTKEDKVQEVAKASKNPAYEKMLRMRDSIDASEREKMLQNSMSRDAWSLCR